MYSIMRNSLLLLAALGSANAYWLMGIEDFITTERIDPIVNPGAVSGHVHSVLGGSNFRFNTTTESLRESDCTSIPIPQDNSNYWFPHLYFQWANGSFSSLTGGAVIYYLFSSTAGSTTAFPDNLRMLTGDPTLRTYNASSYAQKAVTFLCLDFNGSPTSYNELPAVACPSGVRAQINFPSCWDGVNLDSTNHKSHVAFPSGGPDSGTCSDPKYPVTIPRIFIEVYWASTDWYALRDQAMNTTQPFVYSYGDRTGYGYHADFINGWDEGVLQKAVDGCTCNDYGDPTCCVDKGIFDMNTGKSCRITKSVDEQTTGTLDKLPGNNPVQAEGRAASMLVDTAIPAIISPVYAYTGDSPTASGTIVTAAKTAAAAAASASSSSVAAIISSATSASVAKASASAVNLVAGSGSSSSKSSAGTTVSVASTASASASASETSPTCKSRKRSESKKRSLPKRNHHDAARRFAQPHGSTF